MKREFLVYKITASCLKALFITARGDSYLYVNSGRHNFHITLLDVFHRLRTKISLLHFLFNRNQRIINFVL